MQTGQFLKLEEVIGSRKKGIIPIFPISKSTWQNGIKEGRFPSPVKIGRLSFWLRDEIILAAKKIGEGEKFPFKKG